MLILSQDKKHLINLDNVNNIDVIIGKVVCYFHNTMVPQEIGEYDTEDRAKKILEKIQIASINCPYYDMPKE